MLAPTPLLREAFGILEPLCLVGIVYASTTGALRRIVETGNIEENWHVSRHRSMMHPKERMLVLYRSAFPVNYATGERIINRYTIIPIAAKRRVTITEPERCCVVSNETTRVVNAVMADPEIDSIEGHTLIKSEVGNIGDSWDGEMFFRGLVS